MWLNRSCRCGCWLLTEDSPSFAWLLRPTQGRRSRWWWILSQECGAYPNWEREWATMVLGGGRGASWSSGWGGDWGRCREGGWGVWRGASWSSGWLSALKFHRATRVSLPGCINLSFSPCQGRNQQYWAQVGGRGLGAARVGGWNNCNLQLII